MYLPLSPEKITIIKFNETKNGCNKNMIYDQLWDGWQALHGIGGLN
jgi:hypothetical protein